MLLELLNNIEQAVLMKDQETLTLHLDSFQDFLNKALKNITLNTNDQIDSAKVIQVICNIQEIDQDNQALIELKNVLTAVNNVNILLLNLALELHEIDSTLGLKSLVFRNIIAIEARKSGQYLTAYDLSFLSSKARQTVLGKVRNPKSISFFQPYLNTMESRFWQIDDKLDFFYMTTAEKKMFKVKRDTDGALIHANTNTKLINGKFLYVVSPKGSLYIIDKVFNGLHHSTVRAGQPVLCAGHLTICDGEISEIDNWSGHYEPDLQSLIMSCLHLYEKNIIHKECVIRTPSLPECFKVQDISTNEECAMLGNKYSEHCAALTV